MPQYNLHLKNFLPLGGAVIFAGIAGFLYYKLLKDDEEELDNSGMPQKIPVVSSKIEFNVPVHAVGVIIGRHGSNIKEIQELTSTAIRFNDSSKSERLCIIKGNVEKVEKAKELILKIIEDIPVVETSEIHIPLYAVGRVIGRGGGTIKSIQSTSGAKIKVHSDWEQFDAPKAEDTQCSEEANRITIKGSVEQIAAAKFMILEMVSEEDSMRKRIKNSASNMSQRSKARQHENGHIHSTETFTTTSVEDKPLPLSSMANKIFGEVFVSAVHSATHFWVQVVGSKTVDLDKLVSDMSEFYGESCNMNLYLPDRIKPGDIVAAKFPMDAMWYRGRICPPTGHNEPYVHTVYFVDFGDTDEVNADDICELRTDFLRLGFQAIECFLANVDPESATSEESVEAFESLTHACQWKPVMLRVIEYKEEGGDTIPCVRIVDTSAAKDIDVADVLVERGLAKWEDKTKAITERDVDS